MSFPSRGTGRCSSAVAAALVLSVGPIAAQSAGSAGAPVVMDGEFGDWEGVPSAAVVRAAPRPGAPVALREVRVRHDAGNVFLYLDLGREVVAQGLAGTVQVLLDADGDAATGATGGSLPGADVAVLLSPRIRDRSGAVSTIGLGITRPGPSTVDPGAEEVLPADTLGMMVAPSYASTRFEVRIARGRALGDARRLFGGASLRGRVVVLDQAGADMGQSGVFVHPLTPGPERPGAPGQGRANPLARAPGTAFRLLSWNVNGKGLIDHPGPFRAILAALRPDVIMLDEVPANARAAVDSLLASLPSSKGAGPWNVLFGAAGGRQRGVIASRLPVALARTMARVEYPDSLADVLRSAPASVAADVEPAEGVPTLAGYVTVDGRRVLLATVDLKCCGGGLGTPEERIRRIEARAMADAIRRTVAADRPDAVVVAGDFNLVGTIEPLRTLREGTDVDGSALFVADSPRLDGLSYATWMRPRNRFGPGRLDYHLYGDETLRPLRSFAFDVADLSDIWTVLQGMRGSESVDASGHRPVVTDFAWAGEER
jgi:hypothetical protein